MTTKEWMKRKIKGINKKRLNEFVNLIAQNNHKKPWQVKLDLYKNFLERGVGYTDYFRGNYINLTKEEKDTFVTTKSFYKIISYLNDERYEIILHDKLLFNTVFKKYLGREFINLKTATVEEFAKFLQNKDIVFAKVLTGEGGKGISKIDVSKWQVDKLYQKLKSQKQYLVEEQIIQCDEVNKINPHAVNSLRVITLYKDDEVYILNNAFRINQDDKEVIGSTNDLYFRLGIDGTITSNVIDDYGNIYTKHPLTNVPFNSIKIPQVKQAFQMCKNAAKELSQVRYIGWDVAFSKNGPVIVEGNEYPGYGLVQFYQLDFKKTGHKKEIADILGKEMENINKKK